MKYLILFSFAFLLNACSGSNKPQDNVSPPDSTMHIEEVDKTMQHEVDSTIMENQPIYRDSIPH